MAFSIYNFFVFIGRCEFSPSTCVAMSGDAARKSACATNGGFLDLDDVAIAGGQGVKNGREENGQEQTR